MGRHAWERGDQLWAFLKSILWLKSVLWLKSILQLKSILWLKSVLWWKIILCIHIQGQCHTIPEFCHWVSLSKKSGTKVSQTTPLF